MPIEKQSLNNFLPNGFETLNQEGYKENFNEEKIKTGYEKDMPDIVSGPNLNNLIDVVGKNTNTLNNYVNYLNNMPINNIPTVNANGQLDYTNLNNKVNKSGDTMNGILNFNVPNNIYDINIFTNAVDNYKGISVKNNYADSSQGTVSVQEDYMQFTSYDKNEKPTGLSLVKHQTNGNMIHCIRAFKQINGELKQCEIAAVVDVNGNVYGTAPTWTTYTDSSTKIATTAFVQNALKVNSSMPSKKFTNLSFPASNGTNYTAPADGYFILRFYGSSSTFGSIYNSTTHLQAHQYSTSGSYFIALFLPVSKGDVVNAKYYNVDNKKDKEFKFIYTNSYD